MAEDYKDSNTRTHTADTRNPDWEKYVPEGHGRTDEQIRADVHEALLQQGEATRSLTVNVQDGIVSLSGKLKPGQEDELVGLVRNVPSVKDVRTQFES